MALNDRLGQLINLEELSAEDNRIKSLTPSVGQLKKLRVLNLTRNQLEQLPPQIGWISGTLRKLLLSANKAGACLVPLLIHSS